MEESLLEQIERMYADLMDQKAVVKLRLEDDIRALIGDKKYRQLADLQRANEETLKSIDAEAKPIADRWRKEVLEQGASFKGKTWQCQYVSASPSIKNVSFILEFSKKHPELLEAIDPGKATTRIVANK